jgi:hypothetical protein
MTSYTCPMRKTSCLILLLFVILFSYSCVDDKTEVAPGSDNSMTVKIDGATWTPAQVTAYYNSENNYTLITGVNSSMSQQLKIAFTGKDAGTYKFTAADQNMFGSFMVTAASVFIFTTLGQDNPVGQIEVTENNTSRHTISGTFNFDAYSGSVKKTFSEGSFTNVKYDAN